MPRPLMQHGVGQLEEMFTKGKADANVLKQLEQELQYRKMPRAVALLTEVQAAMNGGDTVPPPARASARVPQQHGLWERPEPPPVVTSLPPASARAATPAISPPEATLATKPSTLTPAMPLEEAYKVLKATPGATWESIEQTRRTLVFQSHPSRWRMMSAEKRTQTLAEAKRVNAAYASLSQTRCGHS